MKNMILLVALPFILGCTATAQTTPSKQPKTNRVETFSQLDSTEPAERPNWLQIVPESDEGFYFVGMSTKRTEKRNARNESFNDALIGFARYCGLNVQYLSEHRDTSMGGNGGLINTFSNGNTVAKMQAEMLLGNVATKDRYTEKYSSFYGGSFMGHTFVDATLIYVPKTEMDLCKKNRKQANTFLAQKTKKIKQLKEKNESLENQLVVEKQNTSVALAQAYQSSTFFKQVLNKPVAKKIEKPIAKKIEKPIAKKIEKLNPEQENGQLGTIVDSSTGLMWQTKPDGDIRIWKVAKHYCSNLTLGGYTDWVLPEVEVLKDMIYKENMFDQWLKGERYWASSFSFSNNNSQTDSTSKCHIHFNLGLVTCSHKTWGFYARCVRENKEVASL